MGNARLSSARTAMVLLLFLLGIGVISCSDQPVVPGTPGDASQVSLSKEGQSALVVLGYNDLGMHCMNEDFSEFMILPPYNTLHAQVIERGMEHARIVTTGVTVSYSIPGNTISSTKTNFWTYVQALLGVSVPPNEGLSGHRLSGVMDPTGNGDWSVTGIPLTPMTDDYQINPFQLAEITVNGGEMGSAVTHAVTPVSWELRCDLCHHGAPDAPVSVLDAHDRLHGTSLYDPNTGGPAGGKPVLCGSCHGQIELGLPGTPGTESLSLAMHKAHAPRMMDVVGSVPGGTVCYACHPGVKRECLRDVHARMKMTCYNCHGGKTPETAMLAVGDAARQPWVTLPRCDNCHHRQGYEYEQPGVLFRNSKGHGGVFCEACHNSTHAIVAALDDADNVQSVEQQSHPGTIRKCTVCHGEQPKGLFRHAYAVMSPM